MARILDQVYYGGARERVERLGLAPLLSEIVAVIESIPIFVPDKNNGTDRSTIRELIDAEFVAAGGWSKRGCAGLGWTKSKVVNATRLCIGAEVQFAPRNDLILVEMIRLNKAFIEGRIDVGVLLLPSSRLGPAGRHVDAARLQDSPLIVMAI